MLNEKEGSIALPITSTPSTPKSLPWGKRIVAGVGLSAILYLSFSAFDGPVPWSTDSLVDSGTFASTGCHQAEPLLPHFDTSAAVSGKEGRIRDWLSGAVKIPTEMFDVMGPIGEDKRWDIFYNFSDYLEEKFPKTHEHLKRTKVVTHALVFEWEGSDPSLKPLLLTGHQDVVPVLPATKDLWTHDPFGGEYDGTYIWGRGSSDDKSGLIGIMSAIELLLEEGSFKPARSVVLAFGMDEETGGKVGAMNLGIWLEEKYGKDSVAMLVDEGSGMEHLWGQLYATPAVAEKGMLDVEIRVETAGGHSSVPPVHTGIGYLAKLISAIEDHPHAPHLTPENPLNTLLTCAAASSPKMPKSLRRDVEKLGKSLAIAKKHRKGKGDKKALKRIEEWWVNGSEQDGTLPPGAGRAMVSTTQAVDIINGGVKVNALPEVVTAIVNHRINIASSYTEVQKHVIDTVLPVAKAFNLQVEAFGEKVYEGSSCPMLAGHTAGKIILAEAFNSSLNPAPISPYTIDSPAWRLLSGTTKGTYNSRPVKEEGQSKMIQMAPSYSTGNTDTKRYWNLTKNIYRFAYQGWAESHSNSHAHTVDERMHAGEFVEQVRWFMNLIINVDESREI